MLDQGHCNFTESWTLSGKEIHQLPDKLFPVLCHPPYEQVFLKALLEPLILQFKAVAPLCIIYGLTPQSYNYPPNNCMLPSDHPAPSLHRPTRPSCLQISSELMSSRIPTTVDSVFSASLKPQTGHSILSEASPVSCRRTTNFPQSAAHVLPKVTRHTVCLLHGKCGVGSYSIVHSNKSIYDSYTGLFNNINRELNTQRLESINVCFSSTFKESGWVESQTQTDKQRIIQEALRSSHQTDMHGHNRSFQFKNNSLPLRSEGWDCSSAGNQARKVSARSGSFDAKKLVLKYPTKSQVTLQTSSHPRKGWHKQATATGRLLNVQIKGTETTLLKRLLWEPTLD